jgi:hypothetical protein
MFRVQVATKETEMNPVTENLFKNTEQRSEDNTDNTHITYRADDYW